VSPSPEGIIEDVIGHPVALFDPFGLIKAPVTIALPDAGKVILEGNWDGGKIEPGLNGLNPEADLYDLPLTLSIELLDAGTATARVSKRPTNKTTTFISVRYPYRRHNILGEGACRSLRRAITISPPFFPLNLDCWVLRNAVSKKPFPLPGARFRSRHLFFIASSCQRWV
jgi:hypothetical protein